MMAVGSLAKPDGQPVLLGERAGTECVRESSGGFCLDGIESLAITFGGHGNRNSLKKQSMFSFFAGDNRSP